MGTQAHAAPCTPKSHCQLSARTLNLRWIIYPPTSDPLSLPPPPASLGAPAVPCTNDGMMLSQPHPVAAWAAPRAWPRRKREAGPPSACPALSYTSATVSTAPGGCRGLLGPAAVPQQPSRGAVPCPRSPFCRRLLRGPAAVGASPHVAALSSPPPPPPAEPPRGSNPIREYLDATDAARNSGRAAATSLSVGELESLFPYPFDAFQRRAVVALQRPGGSCVVAAPTSAGKTLVAEAAAVAALAAGARVIYTTPLKARGLDREGGRGLDGAMGPFIRARTNLEKGPEPVRRVWMSTLHTHTYDKLLKHAYGYNFCAVQ